MVNALGVHGVDNEVLNDADQYLREHKILELFEVRSRFIEKLDASIFETSDYDHVFPSRMQMVTRLLEKGWLPRRSFDCYVSGVPRECDAIADLTERFVVSSPKERLDLRLGECPPHIANAWHLGMARRKAAAEKQYSVARVASALAPAKYAFCDEHAG